jgi:hypothetical protein
MPESTVPKKPRMRRVTTNEQVVLCHKFCLVFSSGPRPLPGHVKYRLMIGQLLHTLSDWHSTSGGALVTFFCLTDIACTGGNVPRYLFME